MEISKVQMGERLEVKVKGRLDGYWAEDLRNVMLESIREGAHNISMDLADIDYISSLGLGTLLDLYQRLADIHGSFSVINPSKKCKKLLELSGVDMLLLASSQSAVTTPPPQLREGVQAERENALLEIFEVAPGATLKGRMIGNPDLLHGSRFREEHGHVIALPDSLTALGLGALGEDFEDCRTRFGEFLSVAGATAYQPADGSSVSDYMVSKGTFIPSVNMMYGFAYEGAFSHVIHFRKKKEAKPITLSNLAAVSLEFAKSDQIGMVMIAESAGLLGAWLRQSPAVEAASSAPFAYPEIRKWLSFAAERTFHRSMIVAAGIVAGSEQKLLTPFIRPLWREPFPAGHFHAASFSYRPLKKCETDLRTCVTTLFEEESLEGVLHLLGDDRGAEGTGESEFVRGAIWLGPIGEMTREN